MINVCRACARRGEVQLPDRFVSLLGETTQQVWDGLSVVQQDVGEAGETSLVRDPTGDVAIQHTEGLLVDDTRWGLTDRLGSTIGQAQGSKVGQLANYSDWGVPTFATVVDIQSRRPHRDGRTLTQEMAG